ncbi:MAG: hypothetical protein ABIQ04_05185 [Candidatus Saccharimonadales bacterium]
MVKEKEIKIHKQPKVSNLEKFSLSFEYNVTWEDARKLVRERTHTK